MNLKMRKARYVFATILFLALILQFQNCAVGGQEGTLSLGSGSSGTAPKDPESPQEPICTCPNPATVPCGQAVINSCGVACGTGTNNCVVNCPNVHPSCVTGTNQYRYNGGGGGCGAGPNCDANGNLTQGDCQDCPCRACN